jgi:predicted dehydrogenase
LPADGGPGPPLRVALVGIGSAATRAHLPALGAQQAAGRLTVVGICDRDPARREAVTALHPSARGFGDNDAMLEEVAPDLLVIATPPSAHLGELAAAVSRGVDVLCEKPLGLSSSDVAELRALSASHPERLIASVHQYRYAAPWAWLTRAAAGARRAGEPFTITVEVERPGTDPLSAGGWRTDPEHEGGILGDHAVHYLALMRLLDPATEVLACRRAGPGGREVASVELALGSGRAVIDVSYAGQRRHNRLRLERPAQCLEICWDDGAVAIVHNGRTGTGRAVPSLSDRATVNALYRPMYADVVEGVADPAWRGRETAQTIGVAELLAAARGMSG